jgi:hypothetical protein
MYFMHNIALHTRLPAPTFRVIHSGIYKLSGTHHVREAAPRTGLSFFVFDFSGEEQIFLSGGGAAAAAFY